MTAREKIKFTSQDVSSGQLARSFGSVAYKREDNSNQKLSLHGYYNLVVMVIKGM